VDTSAQAQAAKEKTDFSLYEKLLINMSDKCDSINQSLEELKNSTNSVSKNWNKI
jgi:hypothetical protein